MDFEPNQENTDGHSETRDNAMDTEPGTSDNGDVIQQDMGIDSDLSHGGHDSTLSRDELQSQFETIRRERDALQKALNEADPVVQKYKEEREKQADELSKMAIENLGGLDESNRAGAEAYALKMRDISNTDPVLFNFMKAVQSKAASKQNERPANHFANSTNAPKAATPTETTVKNSSRPQTSTTSSNQARPNANNGKKVGFAAKSQGTHRPVADFTSGKTENIPSSHNNNKRSVLNDLYPDNGGKKTKTSYEDDGFNFGAEHVGTVAASGALPGSSNDLVLMSHNMMDLWSSSMMYPLMDKSANSRDVFFRKSQSAFNIGTDSTSTGLTVAASRCAKGEIPDTSIGRGIMPYSAKCDLQMTTNHDAANYRARIMNGFFPNDVSEQSMVTQLGGVVSWTNSLHIYDNNDTAMHSVVSHSEFGKEFQVINQTAGVTIAASKQAASLNIKGSSMEKTIKTARQHPYFSSYSDSQLMTLACMNNASYLGVCVNRTSIPT